EQRFAGYAVVHPLKMVNDLDFIAVRELVKIARSCSVDILHAHTARGHFLGLLTKKILRRIYGMRVKLIVHRRVQHKIKASIFTRLKYLSSDIDQYICVSRAVASELAASGVNWAKIKIAHSAVDADIYADAKNRRQKIREQFQIPDNQLLVTYVGAVETSKGLDTLLAAWKLCLKNGFSGKIFIVGSGASLETLRQDINSSDLGSSVVLTGFRDDVPDVLCGSDLFVFPTLREGLGTILLDAILSGCAVIGSSVGGVGEIILDGQTGILVHPGDIMELSSAILKLDHDKDLRESLNAAGKRHVIDNFSLNTMINGVVDCYTAVLNGI
ncbi:MAG: glycosyltransferase family 4 protein, partial [Pseudomonadota bacterium]